MTDSKPTKADWQAAASKEVRGKDLTWRTPEGIDVQPVYTAEDAAGIDPGLSGFPPYIFVGQHDDRHGKGSVKRQVTVIVRFRGKIAG